MKKTKAVPEAKKFLAVSYDDDQQQWFWDFVVADTAEKASAYVCKKRPYVIAADAVQHEELTKMDSSLSFCTLEDVKGDMRKIGQKSEGLCVDAANAKASLALVSPLCALRAVQQDAAGSSGDSALVNRSTLDLVDATLAGVRPVVKLTVIGGVADAYEVPKGLTVEVHDYDCDAIDDAEDIKRDADGGRYLLKVWQA